MVIWRAVVVGAIVVGAIVVAVVVGTTTRNRSAETSTPESTADTRAPEVEAEPDEPPDVPETTLARVEVPAGYELTQAAGGLDSPTGIAVLDDGTYLVSLQAGAVVHVDHSGATTEIGRVTTAAVDEEGLTSVAVGPGEPSTDVYLVYTALEPVHHQRLSRFTIAADGTLVGEVTIIDFEANLEPFHLGGAITFDAEGSVLVTTGEHIGNGPRDPAVQGGKVFRIAQPATIAGPLGADAVLAARVASGLRNPWAIAAAADGRVYLNDVGEAAFEEIEQLVDGADYGWPDSEGPIVGVGQTVPRHAYGRDLGCAIVGAAFLDDGYLFMDYCLGAIRRLDPDGTVTQFGVVADEGPVAIATRGDTIAYLTRGIVTPAGGTGGEFADGALWVLEPTS